MHAPNILSRIYTVFSGNIGYLTINMAYAIRPKQGAVSISPEGVPYVSDGHRPSKRRTLTSPERVQYNTLRGYGVYGSVYRQLFFT